MKIEGSRVIITGAGSGFGRQMALRLSSLGARVAALDLNVSALESLVQNDPTIQSFPCNVSNPVEVEKSVEMIFSKLEGVDVLVNNAGIMKNAPLVNFLNREDRKHPLGVWDDVISINQSGVFYMSRACVDRMIAKRCKGVIINISSIAAQGNAGQTAYSASKAAVEAMTKVWAKELGAFGIRSVAIAPGFMDTAGTANALEEKMLAQWIEKTPLRRTGSIDEVVKAVSFIIDNDFLNGVVIPVNGGLVL